jgi:hypothetical protein
MRTGAEVGMAEEAAFSPVLREEGVQYPQADRIQS